MPSGFAYATTDTEVPLTAWRGGQIGLGRLAVEDARTGAESCPVCQHRACVYVILDAGDEAAAT